MFSNSYFDRFSTQLTQQQKNAITCSLGPVLVIAGAGSGKTSVIAHRFIYLVHHFKIDPERILLVTFTNQAAKNIKSRINQYMCEWMRNDAGCSMPFLENIHSMTFHAICKKIIEWVYEHKDKDNAIKFVHQTYFTSVVKEVMQDHKNIKSVAGVRDILVHLRWRCKFQNRTFTEEDLLEIVMQLEDIDEEEKVLKKYPLEDIREIYVKFDNAMQKKKWGTLDDTILNAHNYLKFDKDVIGEWKTRYDAILCDEFQDVDQLQFNVLTHLCSDGHNLFCVGDPDQAIYGFRGSLPQVFIRLKNHFDNKGIYTQIKKLEKNFRSTPQILNVANVLINSANVSDELRKNLVTDRGYGDIPKMEVLDTPIKQTEAVVKKIKELHNSGVKLSEIAVLSRKKSNYNRIKNALLFNSIHYEDYKEMFSLLRGEVIKDVVSWISVAFVDPNSEQWLEYLKRIHNKPPSGIGKVAFQKILDSIYDGHDNIMEILEELASQSDKFMKFIFKINQMRNIAENNNMSLKERYWAIANGSGIVDYYIERHGKDSDKVDTIQKFLDSALVTQADSWQEALVHVENYLDVTNSRERVVCSTIHGVKGLEFKHVFVISLSDGNIPTSRGLKLCKNQNQINSYIDEERRVLYVAITRAKDNLYIYSDKENVSIFLKEIAKCVEGKLPVQKDKVKATRGRPKKVKEETSTKPTKSKTTKSKYSKELLNEKIMKGREKEFRIRTNIARWEQERNAARSLKYWSLLNVKINEAYVKLARVRENLDNWEKQRAQTK